MLKFHYTAAAVYHKTAVNSMMALKKTTKKHTKEQESWLICALDHFNGDKPLWVRDVINTDITLLQWLKKLFNDSAASNEEMLNLRPFMWWLCFHLEKSSQEGLWSVSKIEREPQECNLLSHSLQLLQRIACWQYDFSVNISLILYYYKIALTWYLCSQF